MPTLAHRIRILAWTITASLLAAPAFAQEKNQAVFEKGDRVAWVGSSSTNIGVWPKTMQFLLRTRHPELQLTFKKFSTGGGTFATGLQNIDKWLADFHPTLVVFNYGSNDAGAGEKGLPDLKERMTKCVAKVEATKARIIFTTFQAADPRKSGELPAERRRLYAETLLAFCKENHWPIVDVFHSLDRLQKSGQKDDDKYTILRDKIHLTDPAYVAWGYYLSAGMRLGDRTSALTMTSEGKITSALRCKAAEVLVKDGELTFVRKDEVLPILPPGPLPPRKYVPLEEQSSYRLQIVGLQPGNYEIGCEDKLLGTTSAEALAQGINLNTLLLDSDATAPWDGLAKQIWMGNDADQVGKTAWRFRITRK